MTDEFNGLSTEELEELLTKETAELHQAVEEKNRIRLEAIEKEAEVSIARVKSENVSVSSRMLTVCMFVDNACEMFGRSTASEYEEIEEIFVETFGNTTFYRDVPPHQLQSRRCDIYVIDIGGLGTMRGGEMDSHYRSLYRAIEDKPSTAFVLWSEFTKHYYKMNMTDEIVAEVSGEANSHNVLMYNTSDWVKKCLMIVG